MRAVRGGFEAYTFEADLPTTSGRPEGATWAEEEELEYWESARAVLGGVGDAAAEAGEEDGGEWLGGAAVLDGADDDGNEGLESGTASARYAVDDGHGASLFGDSDAVAAAVAAAAATDHWPSGRGLQPRPLGALAPEGGEEEGSGEFLDLDDEEAMDAAAIEAALMQEGAAEEEEEEDEGALGVADLQALLANNGAEGAGAGAGAPEGAAADPTAAAAKAAKAAAEEAASAERAAAAAAANTPNALAGDSLDADLANLVAELDAPIRHVTTHNGDANPNVVPSMPLTTGAGGAQKSSDRGRKPKVRRVAPAWLVDITHVEWAELHANGRLAKLSIKELKSFLYARNELLSGAKKVLAQRVADCIEREGGIGGDSSSSSSSSSGGGSGGGGGGGGAAGGGGGAVGGAAAQYANGMASAASGGGLGAGTGGDSAAAADESAELSALSSLPPPTEAEEETLTLFRPDASSADAADDFLIDEVFSAM